MCYRSYFWRSCKGVKDLGNEFEVTTFALHKSKKVNKIITNIYNKWITSVSSKTGFKKNDNEDLQFIKETFS